jgi:hypothetical protein
VFLEKENLISHWKGDDLVAGLKGKRGRKPAPRPASAGKRASQERRINREIFPPNRGLFCPNEGLLDDEQG